MSSVKIPYKLKTKLRRLSTLSMRLSELEDQCKAELKELGLVDEDLEFVSADPVKAAIVEDYWVDTTGGFGGNTEELIELLEGMPLAENYRL